MSSNKSTILARRRSLGAKRSTNSSRLHSNNDLSNDSDLSKSNTSIADDGSDYISREDIEREKKNLNLDNFLRKLSIPDYIEINLCDQRTLKKTRKPKSEAKNNRRLSLAVPNDRRPSLIITDEDKESLAKPQDITTKACEYFSQTVQIPTSLKDVVHGEINREEGAFGQMLLNSQLVTAFGRRLFEEDELKDTSSSSDDEESSDSTFGDSKSNNEVQNRKKKKKKKKKKKAQKVVVQSRYMQMFQKGETPAAKNNQDEIEAEKAMEIIRENPTNFGVWDSYLDPATAKVKVEMASKRRSEQQLIDEEVRKKEIEDSKKREDLSENVLDNDKEAADHQKLLPFKTIVATGKYLHENDLKWCKRNTKYSEKDIIKWFRRFRTLCPRGDMTMKHLSTAYHKLFIGGCSDFFCEQIFEQFDVDHKYHLDFKVYLYVVQVGSYKTTFERLHWIYQLLDLDGAGILPISIMEIVVRMFESIERPQRSDNDYDQTIDPSLEDTSPDIKFRSLEDRMERIIKHINGEAKENITKAEFEAIPTRIISAYNF